MKPTLCVTVDTEEEGLWGDRFPATGNSVTNIAGLPRFQGLCDRFGVRPTYLVDTPVVEDDRAAEILSDFAQAGRCEIGSHLHPWCAAPLEGESDAARSFMCNLPESLQREKLRRLTEQLEERFGRRPVSFRAGRYGLDIVGARILEELGYRVDSSVISFSNYRDQGGPSFEDAPFTPYHVGGDDLARPAATGNLLEVPVSVGFNRRRFDTAHRLQRMASRPGLRRLRLVGVMDRTRLVRKI